MLLTIFFVRRSPQDKRQIRRPLNTFEQESPQRSRRLHYWIPGFLTAVGINLSFLQGLRFLLGIAGLANCGTAFSFLKIVFSQEWKKFRIIEQEGQMGACRKLCGYGNYSVLHDVLVLPKCRRRGISSVLVKHLAQRASKPLYLACFPSKIRFYTQLGLAHVRSPNFSFILRHELGSLTDLMLCP